MWGGWRRLCFVTKSLTCVRKWKYCKTQSPRSSTSHANVRTPFATLRRRLSSPHTQEDEIPIEDYPLLTTHSQQHSIQYYKISSCAHTEKTSLHDIAKVIHHTPTHVRTLQHITYSCHPVHKTTALTTPYFSNVTQTVRLHKHRTISWVYSTSWYIRYKLSSSSWRKFKNYHLR